MGTEDVEKMLDVSMPEDNNGCKSEAFNPVNLELSTHIGYRNQFYADNVHKELVQMHHILTDIYDCCRFPNEESEAGQILAVAGTAILVQVRTCSLAHVYCGVL